MEKILTTQDQQEQLLNFFQRFKEKVNTLVRFVQLRPKLLISQGSYFEDDFDFLIRKKDFDIIMKEIYSLCKNQGVNFMLSQRAPNKKLFRFFIHDIDEKCLTIEMWTAIEYSTRNKRKAFPGESILNSIKQNKVTEVELLSLLYITHLSYKNKNIFSDENKYRFGVFLDELSLKSPESEAIFLLRSLEEKKISVADANKKALEILDNNGITGNNIWTEKYKRLRPRLSRKFFMLKKITPIIGPDGVGKGIVSEKGLYGRKNWVSYRFKSLFRIKKLYTFRLSLLKGCKKEPKNKLDERIGLYIFFTAFLVIRILPFYKKKKNILLDRYFTDYLGSPIRYLGQNSKPKKLKLYKPLFFLMPTPYQTVFLGCKDSSLIERKNELSTVSVDFLQKLNCEFIINKKIPKVLFISTENSVGTSAKVLDKFLSRTK